MDPGRDIEPISESTYRTSSECCNLPNIIVFANEYMIDHRSYAHNLSSCGIKAWTGFKPMISVIPVQCFANWDIKPSGSWSLCVFVIYEKMKNLFLIEINERFPFLFLTVCLKQIENIYFSFWFHWVIETLG